MTRGLPAAAAALAVGVLLCVDVEWAVGPGLDVPVREEPVLDVPALEKELFDEEKLLLDEEKLLLDEELCEDEWDLDEPELWLE